MNFSSIFGFKGFVIPLVDNTDKFYVMIENIYDDRILLNLVTSDINRFVNINPKSKKIFFCGKYRSNVHLKIFYMGHEIFDFNTDELNKQIFLYYSNFILKNLGCSTNIYFLPEVADIFRLNVVSDVPQQLFVKIVNKNENEIVQEENFISDELYEFNINDSINYNIQIFNINGEQIYSYDFQKTC